MCFPLLYVKELFLCEFLIMWSCNHLEQTPNFIVNQIISSLKAVELYSNEWSSTNKLRYNNQYSFNIFTWLLYFVTTRKIYSYLETIIWLIIPYTEHTQVYLLHNTSHLHTPRIYFLYKVMSTHG